MKHIKFTAAAALSLASTPAFAVDWVYMLTTPSGSDRYYDADTMQRFGNQVTFWERHDNSRDKTEKSREKKQRVRFDCGTRMIVVLNVLIYFPNGTNESYNFPSGEPFPIAPDTIGEETFDIVCKDTAHLTR